MFDSFPFTKFRDKNRGLDWVVQKVAEFRNVVDKIPETVNSSVKEAIKNNVTDKTLTLDSVPADSKAVGDRIDGLTSADVDAAPSGFGLGGNSEVVSVASITELNNITANGWYAVAFTENTVIDNLTINYACMCVYNFNDENCVQKIIPIGLPSVLLRFKTHGIWDVGFEWENPPMFLGVEYRTTERHNGKPVYVKAVSFGSLPNAGLGAVQHGVENLENILSCVGTLSNASSLPYAGTDYNMFCQSNKTKISIVTTSDASSFTAVITIKYTKTTD